MDPVRLTPARPLRLGIVGWGRIGPVHATAARGSGAWEVVAGVFSRDPEVGRRKGAEWRIDPERIHPDPAAMAEAERARPDGIDAVAITTPNQSHHEIARCFLDAGIHVICDKPLATRSEDARDLVERARDGGLLLGVTYPWAGFPMVREAREIVAAGEVGAVRQVHAEFLQPPPDGGVGWRDAPDLAGAAGTAADVGTHAFQLAEFVTGLRVESVRAELVRTLPERRLDDTAFVSLRFEGGARGTLLLTQAASWNDRVVGVRVFGADAAVAWNQGEAEVLRVGRPGKPELRKVAASGMHPRAAAFVATPPRHPGRDRGGMGEPVPRVRDHGGGARGKARFRVARPDLPRRRASGRPRSRVRRGGSRLFRGRPVRPHRHLDLTPARTSPFKGRRFANPTGRSSHASSMRCVGANTSRPCRRFATEPARRAPLRRRGAARSGPPGHGSSRPPASR